MPGVSTNIEAIFKEELKKLDEFVEMFRDEFVDRVKARTPVLTGRLQAGWESEVSKTEITVSNNVEYAEYIENGTPHISPFGMLKQTVEEADQIADEIAARLRN